MEYVHVDSNNSKSKVDCSESCIGCRYCEECCVVCWILTLLNTESLWALFSAAALQSGISEDPFFQRISLRMDSLGTVSAIIG